MGYNLGKMRNRISKRLKYHNYKEILLKIRSKQGDCTLCPPNHNENHHGEHSKWGRKVAKRRQYTTGKGRKEFDWYNKGPWDLTDYHYKDE